MKLLFGSPELTGTIAAALVFQRNWATDEAVRIAIFETISKAEKDTVITDLYSVARKCQEALNVMEAGI